MGTTVVLLFLAFLVVLGFLAIGNKNAVTVKISFEISCETQRMREFYAKARDASLNNKEQEAKDALAGRLKEDPGNTNALLKFRDIAFSREDYATALEYYRKLREIRPRNLQVLLSRSPCGTWPPS